MSDLRSKVGPALALCLGTASPPALDLDSSGWEAFFVSARDHCLVPYLHHRWLESGGTQTLPPDIARRFSAASRDNAERNRRMLLLLGEIVSALQEREITTLVSKGLPLAQVYYGDPGLRVLYDLDLFVRMGDLDEAFAVLRGLGYEPFLPRHGNEAGRPFWRPREYSWDAERVFDPDRPVMAELHTRPWEPHWHGFSLQCGMDPWQGQRSLDVAGLTLRVPEEERLLIHLAVHFACNVIECSARLMHLLDIVLILRQRGPGLDWQTIDRIVGENHVESFCFVAFALAARIGGCSLPPEIWSRLRDNTPPRIVSWLGSRAVEDVCSMGLHSRDRALIYFLHWNMAGTLPEKTSVLLHSVRGPWIESAGPGRWRSLATRMSGRLQHLVRTSRIR